jgi:hypothetical protein
MCPWIGTISLAFVGPPNVKVQLSPYNRVRLMRIPVLQVKRGGGGPRRWPAALTVPVNTISMTVPPCIMCLWRIALAVA